MCHKTFAIFMKFHEAKDCGILFVLLLGKAGVDSRSWRVLKKGIHQSCTYAKKGIHQSCTCARLWRCHFYPKVTSNRCLKDWKGRRRQQLLESSQITSEPRGSKVGHGLPHPGPCTCSPFVPTTTSKVSTMDSTAEQQESQTCLSISCSSYFPERHV